MKTDLTLKKFVHIFNLAYPSKNISCSDVEYSWCSKSFARCGPRSRFNEVFFARNRNWWNTHSEAERVGLLLHEITHYENTTHNPDFYTLLGEKANIVKNQIDTYKKTFDEEFDYEESQKWVIDNIGLHEVDKRIETTYEARLRLSEIMDIDYSTESAFEGISVQHKCYTDEYDKTVDISNISSPVIKSRESVSNWLTNPRKGLKLTKRGVRYKIEPLNIEPTSSHSYTIPESHTKSIYMYSLLQHKNKKHIPVNISRTPDKFVQMLEADTKS